MRNFHSTPFDEATLVKLDLFRRYIREWLPVFLYRQRSRSVRIVDFFAGPGRDRDGAPGSPLLAVEEIRQYQDQISATSTPVQLILNEYSAEKAKNLQDALEAEKVPEALCSWKVHNQPFEEAFEDLLPKLRQGSNLLLLDQQGVKFLSDEVFHSLIRLPTTDFIFFTASSTWRRFEHHPNVRRHFSMPPGTLTAKAFNDTHREVTEYYRRLANAGSEQRFYLGSFSIKKGSNLYGIIFGSAHPLGIEKFLRLCWEKDPVRGEANFDIDGEHIDQRTPHLFAEMDVPKKLQAFEALLEQSLLTGQLTTDSDVFLASLEEGFLPSHGRNVLNQLIKTGRIRCKGGRPRVSQGGFRDPRKLVVLDGTT